MAIRRLCEALLAGSRFPMYGDGSQSRDFTYVTDAVDATVRASQSPRPPALVNVGGGEEATLAGVVAELEALAGGRVAIDRREAQAGDVRRTGADLACASETLGWRPVVRLRDGLRSELDWVARRGRPLRDVAA